MICSPLANDLPLNARRRPPSLLEHPPSEGGGSSSVRFASFRRWFLKGTWFLVRFGFFKITPTKASMSDGGVWCASGNYFYLHTSLEDIE
ncbi:hypothetical protein CEXT_702791 [Caerostris extrusa]|uniref:Uncharacterized protein n=1 Tax=Caerostris extrusa TaxID=172846 RepID=A0AAV4Q5G4_CAEEX|nr:hypothetical protein CEXT_702791 [Caerostris extrusa]